MPPRFAYWTILIDNGPTAFRARDPEELLPTLNQLKRRNAHVTMKWFSGGKLWDSPDAARESRRREPSDRRPQRDRYLKSDRRPKGDKRPMGDRRRPAFAASRRRKRRDEEPPDRD